MVTRDDLTYTLCRELNPSREECPECYCPDGTWKRPYRMRRHSKAQLLAFIIRVYYRRGLDLPSREAGWVWSFLRNSRETLSYSWLWAVLQSVNVEKEPGGGKPFPDVPRDQWLEHRYKVNTLASGPCPGRLLCQCDPLKGHYCE